MTDIEVITKIDELSVDNSTESLKREIVWLPDQNQNSYNNQIIYDLSSISCGNRWIDLNSSYIIIPYVVSAKSDVDVTVPGAEQLSSDAIMLKDGPQIIQSCQIEVNKEVVAQNSNFSSLHSYFNKETSYSINKTMKDGPGEFFINSNNILNIEHATGVSVQKGSGQISNSNIANDSQKTIINLPTIDGLTPDIVIKSGASYYYQTDAAAADRIYYWVFNIKIPLRSLSDYFIKCPILKTSDVRITLQLNLISMTIEAKAATCKVTSYNQIAGRYNPVLYNNKGLVGGNGCNVTINTGIIKTAQITPPFMAMTSTRIYTVLYDFQAKTNMKLLSMKNTSFYYNDVYNYNFYAETKSSFSTTLTNSVISPMYLVIFPFVVITNTTLVNITSTLQNPFSNISSNVILSDLQVIVGGQNLNSSPLDYDYNNFINEISRIHCINGNSTDNITNGTLDVINWATNRKVYCYDLSRRDKSEDMLNKSVIVQGVNQSSFKIECICFIAFQKQANYITSTGSSIK